MHRNMRILAAGLVSVFIWSTSVFAQAPDSFPIQPKHYGNIPYLSGGVGLDEREALNQMSRDYDLKLSFAVTGGNYLGDVAVEVRDAGTTKFNVALYGELTATTARAHGAVGAVVDGGTRDSGMVISVEFPLFARYRSPIEAFGRVVTVDHQVPIRMSGELTETVIVNPGDFIFGDLDGVLVVPKDLIIPVLVEAERIGGIENAARVEFKRGDDPLEVYKKHRRL